jgi:hypothetical protein
MPSQYEISQVPEGLQMMTPYGEISRDGKLSLSPEGEMKYKEAKVQRLKKFGPHPFADDPNAPSPEARLGGRMFNPFSGMWLEKD